MLLVAAPTMAQTAITDCQIIVQSGSYVVTNNLPGPDGLNGNDCLEVDADFVTIDLNGYTLRGNKKGEGITDKSNSVRSIVVKNGIVTQFGNGINLNDTREAVIDNVQSVKNAGHGIVLREGCQVKNSVISRNKKHGLVVKKGECSVMNNVANHNDDDGIQIRDAGNTVTGNTANSNGGRGLSIRCPSNVIANTFVGNSKLAIAFESEGCNDIDNIASP
jgi:parallel beta-helix repeat protein